MDRVDLEPLSAFAAKMDAVLLSWLSALLLLPGLSQESGNALQQGVGIKRLRQITVGTHSLGELFRVGNVNDGENQHRNGLMGLPDPLTDFKTTLTR